MDKLTSTITLDDLILRCRLDFTNKIRPLFIKDSCECCGATDNQHKEVKRNPAVKNWIDTHKSGRKFIV